MHTLVNAYVLPLPASAVALGRARVKASEWLRYDWLRILGYMLWRELGADGKANCEEVMQRGWLAGGLTFSDRTSRTSVRLLREIAHACGTPVPLEALG